MNFKKVFQLLIDFLEKQGIDYALIGAFALKAYGYVRATQDIDLLADGGHQERIIEFLESLGFETLYRSSGYSNHVHGLSGLGRIDFVYVRGETAEKIFSQTRRLLILDKVSIPVVRPEDLVALKLFAIKNDPKRSLRDMSDIQFLLGLPGVDMEEVKKFFKAYGQIERFHELTGKKDKT